MGISNENQNRTFQDNSMYMETTPAPVQVCSRLLGPSVMALRTHADGPYEEND